MDYQPFHKSHRSDRSRSAVDHLLVNPIACCYDMSCIIQTQPKKHVLDHADFVAPTHKHELDHEVVIDDLVHDVYDDL